MNKIVDINNTKKYIKLSSVIVQNVVNDQVLSKRASCLWIYLYTISYHLPGRKISICQQQLAWDHNVSLRTISRAISELIEKGFLGSEPLDQSDPYSIHTYECLIPSWLHEECLEEPSITINTQLIIEEAKEQENCESKQDSELGAHNEYLGGGEVGNDSEEEEREYTHIQKYHNKYENKLPEEAEKPIKFLQDSSPDDSKSNNNSCDKKDVHMDINYLYIKTQCMDCEYLQYQCKKIKQLLDNAMDNFIKSPTLSTLSDKNRLESEMIDAEMKLKIAYSHNKKIEEDARLAEFSMEIANQVSNNDKLLLSKVGKREISGGLFWWLKKKLYSFGIRESRISSVINEIIYSVRFGSLSMYKNSSEEMPIMRSLNIALKLIKDKRWQTPVNFVSKLASI